MAQRYVDLQLAARDCAALRDAGAISGGESRSGGRWGWGKRECLVTSTTNVAYIESCCMHKYPNSRIVCCQCNRPYPEYADTEYEGLV